MQRHWRHRDERRGWSRGQRSGAPMNCYRPKKPVWTTPLDGPETANMWSLATFATGQVPEKKSTWLQALRRRAQNR